MECPDICNHIESLCISTHSTFRKLRTNSRSTRVNDMTPLRKQNSSSHFNFSRKQICMSS